METRVRMLGLLIIAWAVGFPQTGYCQTWQAPEAPIPDPAPRPATPPALAPEPVPEYLGFAAEPDRSWYFMAEAMALTRDASRDRTFAARIDQVLPEVGEDEEGLILFRTDVLGTHDLDFDFRAGGRALVGRNLSEAFAVEVSYFGVNTYSESAFVRDSTEFDIYDEDDLLVATVPGSLFSPFSEFGEWPINGLDYNNLVSIEYKSSLDNLEWNLRRSVPMPEGRLTASALVGGRYMDIGERFRYVSQSYMSQTGTVGPARDTAVNDIATRTSNEMLGVQIGALVEFQVEPYCWFDFEIKGAVFDNRIRQTTDYVNVDTGVASAFSGTRSGNTTAFMGDLDLVFVYRVSPAFTFRLGYQAVWIDGLALASENMARNVDVLTLGPPMLVDDGKVVYHGPHLGGILAW